MKQPALILTTILLGYSAIFAQPNRNVNFVSEALVSGDYKDIKIAGDRIYCANIYRVVVWTFDDQNPDQPPVEIGRFATPGKAQGLYIEDTLCFVADGYRGLRIYDVSDLNSVEEIGVCEEAAGVYSVVVRNGIAYAATENIGIYTLDVSDPASPELLGLCRAVIGSQRMILRDDLLWTLTYHQAHFYLTIFDISNPRDVSLAIRYTDHIAGGFSINGNTAFTQNDTVFVLDITDPRNIQLISAYHNWDGNGYTYINGYLYGDSQGGFSITDARNVNRLFLFGTLAGDQIDTGIRTALLVRNNYFFSRVGKRGFKIINIANPRHPVLQHINTSNGWIWDVAFKDNHLFVADAQTGFYPDDGWNGWEWAGRFRVFDVENLHNPTQVAELDFLPNQNDWGFSRISIINSTAYLGGDFVSLNIFDIRNPERPRQLLGGGQNERRIGSAQRMTIFGDYMFWTDDVGYISIISIADPEDPFEFSTYHSNETRCGKVMVKDDQYLFVSGNLYGNGQPIVFTFDWSNPESLQRVGEAAPLTGGYKGDGVYYNDYLYLVRYFDDVGLSVVNVEDPLHPREVYYTNEVRSGVRIIVAANHLFIAEHYYGVRIFSLENPARPEQVGYYDTPATAVGIAVDEVRGFMFVADRGDLSIYDIGQLLGVWDLTLSETSHDFSEIDIDSTAIWEFSVANHSECEIVVDSLRIEGYGFAADIIDGDSISPDDELMFRIFFQPDSNRAYSAEAVVYSAGRQLKAQLSGRGAPLSGDNERMTPYSFKLYPPFPNPFNQQMSLNFSLRGIGFAKLAVFDVTGRQVAEILTGEQTAGLYRTVWNAEGFGSGVYLIRLSANGETRIRKAVLVK